MHAACISAEIKPTWKAPQEESSQARILTNTDLRTALCPPIWHRYRMCFPAIDSSKGSARLIYLSFCCHVAVDDDLSVPNTVRENNWPLSHLTHRLSWSNIV